MRFLNHISSIFTFYYLILPYEVALLKPTGISLFIELFKVIKTFLDESVKFWHSGCAKCTFMLINYMFFMDIDMAILEPFQLCIVTEWKNNSFYCFSYELIYKLIKDFYQSHKLFFCFWVFIYIKNCKNK